MDEREQEYYDTLTDDEKKSIEIAKKTLESSFDLSRSIGFQKYWEQKKLKTNN